jgi:hypothetical protein
LPLLQNLATDSISAFLSHGGPGPKLKWVLFKAWCGYVYEHTPELSGLRTFASKYFYYALMVSIRSTPSKDLRPLEYSVEEMYLFASQKPDFMRALFLQIRSNNSLTKTNPTMSQPWWSNPCEYHAHSEGWTRT